MKALDKLSEATYNTSVASDSFVYEVRFMRADRASVLTRITALYVDKVATPVLEPFGLSLAQYKIVGYLYRAPKGTVTTAELEEYFQMSHSTSVGLLNSLETNGFIWRKKTSGSGRSKVIFLTEKAMDIRNEIEAAGDRIEQKFTERLTDEETKMYILISRKILDMKESED